MAVKWKRVCERESKRQEREKEEMRRQRDADRTRNDRRGKNV